MHRLVFKISYTLITGILLIHITLYPDIEKKMVVIIPSYKNEQWIEKNLTSVFQQKYENYRIIYIDDCSPDNTYNKAVQLREIYHQQDRMTIIHNKERCGAMANWYRAIHLCDDNEIVVQLDGDDWLAHENVLSYLNEIYTTKDIWMTYGQFTEHPSGITCYHFSQPQPKFIIKQNLFRQYALGMSHLRTSYAWLFKSIKLETFFYKGNFYPMTCDIAMLFTEIELAAYHHYCVPCPLYIYNNTNPISDHRVNRELQYDLCLHCRNLPPYQPLDTPKMTETLDEFDNVSLILLSENHSYAQIIDSCSLYTQAYKQIYVMLSEEIYTPLSDNLNIKFIPYTTSNFISEFKHCLEMITSRYVFLSTDCSANEKFDLILCIKLLHKTQSNILYLVSTQDKDLQSMILEHKLPNIFFKIPVYAFCPENNTENAEYPVLHNALWRKETLMAMQKIDKITSSKELTSYLQNYITEKNILGIILNLTDGNL